MGSVKAEVEVEKQKTTLQYVILIYAFIIYMFVDDTKYTDTDTNSQKGMLGSNVKTGQSELVNW